MTVVRRTLEKLDGDKSSYRPWVFETVIRRSGTNPDTTTITPDPIRKYPTEVDGKSVITADLDPGPCLVTYQGVSTLIEVPDSDTPEDLQGLIDEGVTQSGRNELQSNSIALRGRATKWVRVSGHGIPSEVGTLWQQYIAESDTYVGEPVDYLPDVAAEVSIEVGTAVTDQVPPAIAAAIADKWVVLDVEGDWPAAGIGPLGEFWWGLHADGSYEAHSTAVGDGAVSGSVDAEDVVWAPLFYPDGTYPEIHLDEKGQLQKWACEAIVARGGSVFGVGTVHVLIGMGQSNMSGRGVPISAEIDPPNPRIFQFGAHATEISTATVPLDMVDVPDGISPLTLIAREYLKRLPPGDVVLLIPAAKGSSSLGASTGTYSNGVWNAAYVGASQNLYALAKVQITAALAAAATKWPGATIRKVGMFWHQGEAGVTGDEALYASRFDAIVADLRAHVSDSNLPVVLGGMVPEWVDTHAGLSEVRAAHVDTPKRLVRTGYAYPPANGGGGAGMDSSHLVHFSREGLEELSPRMLLAWDRALRNTTSSIPLPPAVVSATVNGTALTVKWSQPMCRYTAFVVEYSENGGSWTAITHTTVDTTATATIAALPVRVRVSTTNGFGTSAPSTPVYATIIKEP